MPAPGNSLHRRPLILSRLTLLPTMVVVVGVALAGCSTSPGPDPAPAPSASVPQETASPPTAPSPTPEPTALTFEQVEAAYAECLSANGSEQGLVPSGVDLSEVAQMTEFPDEVLLELGTTREAIVAHAACWPAFLEGIEAGATPAPSDDRDDVPADPAMAAMMAEAVACLNDRGWDFLEPGVETGALTMAARASGFDWTDQAFLDDQRECQQLAGMMG